MAPSSGKHSWTRGCRLEEKNAPALRQRRGSRARTAAGVQSNIADVTRLLALAGRDGPKRQVRTSGVHARHAGCDLLLAAPRQQVQRMLAITRLIDVFAVHACVDEAAGSAGRIPAATTPAAGSPLLLALR